MRLKPLAMGSVAFVALAVIGASSSFAQTSSTAPANGASMPAQTQATPAATGTTDNDSSAMTAPVKHVRHHVRHHAQTASESTPAEREQTADLNKQQVAQAEGQASGNMQAQAGSEQTAQSSPNTQSTSSAASAPTATDTKTAAKVPLDNVKNPKETLAAAKVQNSSGQQIGQVKKVTVGSDGKTQSVSVSLQSTDGSTAKTVNVNADQLSYDKDNNVLITPLSQDQIQALPTNPM